MTHGNDMRLDFFTTDENFPFYIQYGNHEQEMFIHGHEDFSELVIVLGGQATHIVDNENFTVSKGDVFVMNQGIKHGYDKAENFKICNIMFRPEHLIGESYDIKALPGYHALFLLEPEYNKENGFKSRLKLDPAAFSEAENIIKAAIKEFESDSPARKTMVRSYFLQLIVLLSRLYGRKVKHKEIEGISNAAAYMETNFADDITTAKLVELSHYSQRHFIRLFSATYSVTPQQYLIDIRIRNAVRLLRTTDLSITETALRCGFSDSNYFCRIFKKYIGVTPSAYRKSAMT
ncbi:MAG: AraC family transcriptional regulator [Ruminiclostridium sp.]|nr:AraC family transcriptional regulator [Ruminiclostridium sp.]